MYRYTKLSLLAVAIAATGAVAYAAFRECCRQPMFWLIGGGATALLPVYANDVLGVGASGYGVLWNAFKRLAMGASAAEKAALFSGTAARVYKLALA